jgi:flagellar motor switch protein FliM
VAVEQILSQDEIYALLDAIGKEKVDLGHEETPAESPSTSQQQRRFKKHDFSGPGTIAKDNLRAMNYLHQQFARTFSSSLSNLLRSLAEVECNTVDQLTYGDFAMSLSDPSCLCKLLMTPLSGTVVMEIGLELVFPMIEKLLGGQGRLNFPRRRMTEIEKEIIKPMTDLITRDLSTVWKKAKEDIEFRLDGIETEPDYVQIVSPNETVVLVVLSIKFAQVQGIISICFPFTTIERALAEARYDEWRFTTSSFGGSKDEEYRPKVQQGVDKTSVPVRAIFPATTFPICELSQLRVGHVLELDVRVENSQIVDPVIIEVAGKARFLGKLGRSGRKKAVKVTGIIDEDEW